MSNSFRKVMLAFSVNKWQLTLTNTPFQLFHTFSPMENANFSFSVPVKEKKVVPQMKTNVSSLFKKPVQNTIRNNDELIEELKKKKKKKIAPKSSAEGENATKTVKESPFLRRLRQQQQGIKPPPPVPTSSAYNANVPIGGFGEVCLRRQGWQPGLKIGEIEAEDEFITTINEREDETANKNDIKTKQEKK